MDEREMGEQTRFPRRDQNGFPSRKTQQRPPMRRLERRNAQRYENDESDTDSSVGEGLGSIDDRHSQSLDILPSYDSRTSFRIHGSSPRELDVICRNLGLSGPEDFAIPAAAWEARKSRSSSDRIPRCRIPNLRLHEDDPSHEDAPAEIPVQPTSGDGIKGPRPPPLDSVPTPPPPLDSSLKAPSQAPLDSPQTPRDDVDDLRGEVQGGEGARVEAESVEIRDSDSNGTSSVDDSSSAATEAEEFAVSPGVKMQRVISGWTLGKELGRGSFGTVYEAYNYDGFFFAVKEVSLLDQGINAQQCIQQLEHEISLLSHIEHPNIVQYLGTEKGEAKLFIFLELVTQGSLASLYRKYQLRDSQVSPYTRQILQGLKYLHEKNIVHRDIKCANILVDVKGYVKLADFGLAKETSKLNMLKSCQGSVYWMAPEVIQPNKTYGAAADIWSLGCTVLEMLTQNIPYPNLEWAQAFFMIGRGKKPGIPESLSSEARDFISQCVQVNPDDRPTASQLLDHPFVRKQHATGDGSSHGRRLQET